MPLPGRHTGGGKEAAGPWDIGCERTSGFEIWGNDVKYKFIAVAATAALLLAGCGAPDPESSPAPSPAVATTAAAEAKTVPDLAGRPFPEARGMLVAERIEYDAVGTDGNVFSGNDGDTSKVAGTKPAAGEKLQPGAKLTVNIDSTQATSDAARITRIAAAKRAVRYNFKCSPSESAITAKDTQSFNSVQKIWAAADFAKFKSCDLRVDGFWYMDKYTLEPEEAAVVQQIGADGGDTSAPHMAYGAVQLLCALPPKEGWDTRYGEYPSGGPKVRAVAKAAAAICPDAPHVAELVRVAGGVAPAPKTSMGDGTFVVGREIAEGTYQVAVPAGANGVHDCYWERTSPQGGTIDNDFVSFAPQGPVVTVYDGEGFVSKRCGSWTKLG